MVENKTSKIYYSYYLEKLRLKFSRLQNVTGLLQLKACCKIIA